MGERIRRIGRIRTDFLGIFHGFRADVSPKIRSCFKGQNAVIQCVAISPDKTKVLTGGNNRQAILWDIRGAILHGSENQEYDVIGVHFSPDGKSLLTLIGETAKLWSLNGSLLRTFEGHYATVVKAAFAPNQSKILTGDDRGHLKLWGSGMDVMQNTVVGKFISR